MSEIPTYTRVFRVLRIVLMAQAPVGLALLVVSVTHAGSPNAPMMTYGGLILILAGLLGSFVSRLSMTKTMTWWTIRRFADVVPTPTMVRTRAWVTTLIAAAILIVAAFLTEGRLPGLPQQIVFPVMVGLVIILWLVTRWLRETQRRQSQRLISG